MSLLRSSVFAALCAATVLAASPASAQTKWNLPGAYPPDNPHTVNLLAFAKDAGDATGGKLQITIHSAASLFICAGNQARGADRPGAGWRGADLVARKRRSDVFGLDVVPFIATSYVSPQSCGRQAARSAIEKKLAAQGLMLVFAVPWGPQGIYAKKDLNSMEDMKGLKWRAYNVGTTRIEELVGAQSVTVQAAEQAAGAGDRRRQRLHDLFLDRL